jgi:uncharacterized membrane protein YhhN
MPATALALIAVTMAAADWVAVARGDRRAELVLKPLTMVVLIAAAVALRGGVPTVRWALVVAALAFSLAGDVFLMVPNRFLEGVAAFLLAHVAYIAAFVSSGLALAPALIGAVVVVVVSAVLYARILKGLAAVGQRSLAGPLSLYVAALSGTVIAAVATLGAADWTAARSVLAIAAATLFYSSDAMIGWTRFVGDFPRSRVVVMVTYHLAQIGLVLALLR